VNSINYQRLMIDNKPFKRLIQDDVMKLMQASGDDWRTKSFVAVLWDTGARRNALANACIKDVKFDKHGVLINMGVKTFDRNIRLMPVSLKTFLNWYEMHPFKDNPESPIWFSKSKRTYGKKLPGASVTRLLEKLGKRAKINKPVNPHYFRKSRITDLELKGVPRSVVEDRCGRVRGSKVIPVYVKTSGEERDRAMLALGGYEEIKDAEKEPTLRVCNMCKHENPPTRDYCEKCIQPLTLAVALERDKEDIETENLLIDFMKIIARKNPNIKKDFKKLVKSRGMESVFK